MPKLWEESIASHREAVREAIADAAWKLAEERGPFAVTMSQVAAAAGIGRATLYKYFPDVESMLIAHHARHVEQHLEELEQIRRGSGSAGVRLARVVDAYAQICFHRAHEGTPDLSVLVHRGFRVDEIERRLHQLFAGLINEARAAGEAPGDTSPGELATYCLYALQAAGRAATIGEVSRLVNVVLLGLGCAASREDDRHPSRRRSHRH